MKLALSGGGFRATLFHLGVIRYLREHNQLKGVEEIYSVSGGSILAAHLVLNWNKYTSDNEDLFREAAKEIITFVQLDVRGNIVRLWLLYWSLAIFILLVPPSAILFWTSHWLAVIGTFAIWFILWLLVIRQVQHRWAMVELLKGQYAALYGNSVLGTIAADGRPPLFLLSTNFTTGGLAYFDSHGFALNVTEANRQYIVQEQISLCVAVAASSAFPPMFSPVRLTQQDLKADAKELPNVQYLSDGGVFDNLGIRPAILRHGETKLGQFVISNAERRFDWVINDTFGFLPKRAIRSSDILMQRVSSSELRSIGSSQDIRLISLQDDDEANPFLPAIVQRGIRNIRTDLDRFSSVEIQLLYFKGYGATRKSFEQRVDPIPGVTLSGSGVPLTAIAPNWLPIEGTDSGLATAASEALKESGLTRWGVWSTSDWRSWITAAILLLSLLFSPYGINKSLDIYHSYPATVTVLTTAIERPSSEPGSAIIDKYEWLLPHLQSLQAGSDCKVSVQAVALTEEIGNRTGGRLVKPFQLNVKPKVGIQISDGEAFLISGSTASFVELAAKRMDSDVLNVHVPPCGPKDRVLVIAMLCDSNSQSVLNLVRPLTEVVDIEVAR